MDPHHSQTEVVFDEIHDVVKAEKAEAMMKFRMRTNFHYLVIFTILYLASSFFHSPDFLPRLHFLFHNHSFIFILLNLMILIISSASSPEPDLDHHHHNLCAFSTTNYYAEEEVKVLEEESNNSLAMISDDEEVLVKDEGSSVSSTEEAEEEEEEEDDDEMAIVSNENPMDELSSEEFRVRIENFIAANKKSILCELMAEWHRETTCHT